MLKEKHRNTIEYQVNGRYALFSDILTRSGGEKFSYPIPTYGALKGITNAIYFKPTFVWIIDAVRVMNPIQTFQKGTRPIGYSGGNDLSYSTYLKDVCYQVRAHFEWNFNHPELEFDRLENKHHNIAKRMVKRGGRRSVSLGTSECGAYIEPCVFGEDDGYYDEKDEMQFGLMEHSIIYADEAVLDEDKGKMTLCLWQPVMNNGVIEFIRPEQCKIKRHIRDMGIKVFGKNENNFTGVDEYSGGDLFELD